MSQWECLRYDIIRMLGKDKWRIVVIFFSRIFAGIFWYRIDRSLYLLLGGKYRVVRVLLNPFFYLVQAYSNLDIHYKADIGPGLTVLHSSVGIVISGKTIVGKNFTLTGGNVVGATKECKSGEFVIGDNCFLGANACIIGPLTLANNIRIGACACVVKSYIDNDITLVGVPAKVLVYLQEM